MNLLRAIDYMTVFIKAITDPLFYKRKMMTLISSIQVITQKEYDEEECARIAYVVYAHWLNIEQLHDACSNYFIDKTE